MKPEQWILVSGVVLALIVVIGAMFPQDMLEEDVTDTTALIANAAGAGAGISNPGMVNPDVKPVAGMRPASPTDGAWGQNAALPGLVPFNRAKTQKFTGRVSQIVSRGTDIGWGQVHVWINDGGGALREISIAPEWFLTHLGCTVKKGMRVSGNAFRFNKSPTAELYAKSVTVNGKLCRVRNDEGFALWSNRLQ